jgi:hypothetical protein
MNRLCTKRVFPITVLCALVASLLLCSADITLPANFHYELLFDNLPHVRSMTISPSGIVYVGSFLPQNDPVFIGLPSDVYALDVTNRKVYTVASGLVVPNGVAFRNGNLYIGLVDQILVVRDVEANLQTPPAPEVFMHLVNSSLVLPNPLHRMSYPVPLLLIMFLISWLLDELCEMLHSERSVAYCWIVSFLTCRWMAIHEVWS